jgi:hypothetical protein
VKIEYARAGEPFRERIPKLSIIFEEFLSCAHEYFEQQTGVFESCITIINYYYDIVYYNYISVVINIIRGREKRK